MPALHHLKLLVSLARVDGEVVEKEKQYIINIGQANHFLVSEILPLFAGDHEQFVPEKLTKDEKFDYIFTLVQLMRIDGRIYQDEIKYCAQVASRLGYQRDLLFELMLKVQEVGQSKDDVSELKRLTSEYLLRS